MQVAALFIEFVVTGRRLIGGLTALPLIPYQTFTQFWNANNGLPPNTFFTQVINDYAMDAFGSNRFIDNFVPLRADLNSFKGSIFGLQIPKGVDELQQRARRAAAGNVDEYNHLLTTLQGVCHVGIGVRNFLANLTSSSLRLSLI